LRVKEEYEWRKTDRNRREEANALYRVFWVCLKGERLSYGLLVEFGGST